jgi:hypothetical protein
MSSHLPIGVMPTPQLDPQEIACTLAMLDACLSHLDRMNVVEAANYVSMARERFAEIYNFRSRFNAVGPL